MFTGREETRGENDVFVFPFFFRCWGGGLLVRGVRASAHPAQVGASTSRYPTTMDVVIVLRFEARVEYAAAVGSGRALARFAGWRGGAGAREVRRSYLVPLF